MSILTLSKKHSFTLGAFFLILSVTLHNTPHHNHFFYLTLTSKIYNSNPSKTYEGEKWVSMFYISKFSYWSNITSKFLINFVDKESIFYFYFLHF